MSNLLFASTIDGRWHPGIGDPTFLGWFTAAAYLVGSLVCLRTAIVTRQARKESAYWIVFGVFLFALGINKQLDLQTWFTEVGKDFAESTGWYAERRVVQAAFIALITFFGLVVMVFALWWTRGLPAACRFALAGGIFLGTFIVIRAASFHHVDQMLNMHFGGVRMNVILEVGGIACVTVAAWLRLAFAPGTAAFEGKEQPAPV